MNKIWLSKSSYLKGLQCSKALVLHKYHYLQRDAVTRKQQALFDDGHDIEDLARRQLFPNGMNLKPKSPLQWPKVIKMTTLMLQNGQPLLYEAALQFKGVMCAIDVLKNVGDKEIEIFEIKRSRKLKQVFLHDMAIQYWIATHAGYKVKRISLVQPKPDIDELEFQVLNLTDEIKSRQHTVQVEIEKQYELLQEKQIPAVDMGEHCHKPYRCSFIGFCTKQQLAREL